MLTLAGGCLWGGMRRAANGRCGSGFGCFFFAVLHVKAVYDTVGKAEFGGIDKFGSDEACDGEEDFPCGDDNVGAVGLQVVLFHALFHGELFEPGMYLFEQFDGHAALLPFLFLGQAVELIDVSSRTDDVHARVRLSELGHVGFQAAPFAFGHGVFEDTHGADVVRAAQDELPAAHEVDFRTATAHVHIEPVGLAVFHVFQVVVVDDFGLFLSVDDFDAYACLLFYFADDVGAVLGVAHGRCGAGAVGLDAVDLHELAVGFHQAHHVVGALFRDAACGKHVEAEAQRDAQQQDFGQMGRCFLFVRVLDEQTYGV